MEVLKNREYLVTYSYYNSGMRFNTQKFSLSIKDSESWESLTQGIIGERLLALVKATCQYSEIGLVNFWIVNDYTSGITDI